MLCRYLCWVLSAVLLISVSITTQVEKDARCHMLKYKECNVSIYKILNFEQAGWFYHPPFRSCRPFYASSNGSSCQENQDLFSTEKECEELCGEPCDLPENKTGICKMEGSCDIEMPASWNPTPCHAYNVQCCPK